MVMISSLKSWWDDVNESETWQQTIFYVLCAAYSIVGTVAFVSNSSFLISRFGFRVFFGDIHVVFFHIIFILHSFTVAALFYYYCDIHIAFSFKEHCFFSF